MSVNIRISRESRDFLRDVADKYNTSIQAILEKAILYYKKQLFYENLNKSCDNQKSYKDYQAELKELEGTLTDGIMEEDFEY